MRIISLAIILCGLLSSCGSQRGTLELSRDFFAQGNYYQAYTVLAESRDPDSLDEELEREYWRARLFYLLSRGQELVFLDREAEAIEELQIHLAVEKYVRFLNCVGMQWWTAIRMSFSYDDR